jgi:hypothetical protein
MNQSRKRYEGLVWIRQIAGDPADGRITTTDLPRQPIGQAITTLTARWGLLIEAEQVNGTYVVRCIPRGRGAGSYAVTVAAGYTGANLNNILACAIADYTAISDKPWDAELSKREVLRFVVP